jgi:hypothetical protein
MFPVAAVVRLDAPVTLKAFTTSLAPKVKALPLWTERVPAVNEPPPSLMVPIPPLWPIVRLPVIVSALPDRLRVPEVPLPLPSVTLLANWDWVNVTVAVDAAPVGVVLPIKTLFEDPGTAPVVQIEVLFQLPLAVAAVFCAKAPALDVTHAAETQTNFLIHLRMMLHLGKSDLRQSRGANRFTAAPPAPPG